MTDAARPLRPLAGRPRALAVQALWSVGLLLLVLHLVAGVTGFLDDGCPGCDNLGLIQIEAGSPRLMPCLSSWPCDAREALCQRFGHCWRPSARPPPRASHLAAV